MRIRLLGGKIITEEKKDMANSDLFLLGYWMKLVHFMGRTFVVWTPPKYNRPRFTSHTKKGYWNV